MQQAPREPQSFCWPSPLMCGQTGQGQKKSLLSHRFPVFSMLGTRYNTGRALDAMRVCTRYFCCKPLDMRQVPSVEQKRVSKQIHWMTSMLQNFGVSSFKLQRVAQARRLTELSQASLQGGSCKCALG